MFAIILTKEIHKLALVAYYAGRTNTFIGDDEFWTEDGQIGYNFDELKDAIYYHGVVEHLTGDKLPNIQVIQ